MTTEMNIYMIACISRSLNVHEKKYGLPQEEMLAAVWAIKTFHTYLHGQKFTLATDHQPLTYLMTKNDLVVTKITQQHMTCAQ
jgi:hypothetical protein